MPGCRAITSGCGTASSAATSTRAGSQATEALPPTCLGHIGYSVVPWKRRLGYATAALREMLREFAAEGLRYAEITTDPDNIASRRVIEANGGVLDRRVHQAGVARGHAPGYAIAFRWSREAFVLSMKVLAGRVSRCGHDLVVGGCAG